MFTSRYILTNRFEAISYSFDKDEIKNLEPKIYPTCLVLIIDSRSTIVNEKMKKYYNSKTFDTIIQYEMDNETPPEQNIIYMFHLSSFDLDEHLINPNYFKNYAYENVVHTGGCARKIVNYHSFKTSEVNEEGSNISSGLASAKVIEIIEEFFPKLKGRLDEFIDHEHLISVIPDEFLEQS